MSQKSEAQILTDLADLKRRVAELERFMEEPLCVHFTKAEAGKRWTLHGEDPHREVCHHETGHCEDCFQEKVHGRDALRTVVVPAADLDAANIGASVMQTHIDGLRDKYDESIKASDSFVKQLEAAEAREKGLRERIAAIKPWTWQEDGRGSRTYLIRVQDLDAALAEKGKE